MPGDDAERGPPRGLRASWRVGNPLFPMKAIAELAAHTNIPHRPSMGRQKRKGSFFISAAAEMPAPEKVPGILPFRSGVQKSHLRDPACRRGPDPPLFLNKPPHRLKKGGPRRSPPNRVETSEWGQFALAAMAPGRPKRNRKVSNLGERESVRKAFWRRSSGIAAVSRSAGLGGGAFCPQKRN